LLREAPATAGPIASLGIVLWLIFTVVVAVAGTVLLESSQVGRPLTVGLWSLALLIAEIICYLLVLTVAAASSIGASRAFVGTLLGLIVRGGISVITAQVTAPVQVTTGSFWAGFSYFYLLYWPGVLVQICAVAIFLWVVRDTWTSDLTDEFGFGAGAEAYAPLDDDQAVRQRELLAALMESDEDEVSEPPSGRELPEELPQPSVRAGFYDDLDSRESLMLALEETDSEPPGVIVDMPAAEEERADDTSRLPVVSEEPEVGPEVEPQEQPEVKPVVTAASTTPFGGGVLVWEAEDVLDEAKLADAVGLLVGSAEAFAQAARAGAIELLLIEVAEGCWVLAADREREGWWVGRAQPGPVSLGQAATSARQALAEIAGADMPEEAQFSPPPPVAEQECPQQTVSHPLADPLLEQWGLTMTLGEVGEETVLVAAPGGRDRPGLASAGLQMWQAACQLVEVTGWDEPNTVLIGGRKGATAVGRASWQGQPALLAAAGRDIIQVAGAKLLVARLADKLRDYGPRYTPNPPVPTDEPTQ